MGTTRAIYRRINDPGVLAFDEELAYKYRENPNQPAFNDWHVAFTFESPTNEIVMSGVKWVARTPTRDYTAHEIASGDVFIINSQVDSRAEAKRRLKVLVEKYGRPTFDAAMKDLNPTDGENSA